MSPTSRKLLLSAAQLVVALVFLKGFLLTRVELPDVAQCQDSGCSGQPPTHSKAVVLIVDAVRYDFLCGKGSTASLMPKTLGWVHAGAGAAVASRFVADTPTITMSRLKALLTGGLPTFLDVGQSFSASAITEDNLLQQLLARNKTLVMMGDDTWMQLAQHAFAEAYPYPSFNVHDLHTVDDGVWQHLLPLLERPGSWDVLIAHYLGVDHAGHTYGVDSRHMEDKLAQMDDQVSTVIESLVQQAGPGGAYADTLLVVVSDHGQTQGGDHGGGTPDETDSILVAMSLRLMNATLQLQQQQQAQATDNASGQNSLDTSKLLLRLLSSAGYADSTLVGEEAAAAEQAAAAGGDSVAGLSELLACRNTVPQIDLTPVLAHALGVPIPFGNLGKLPPHLFVTLAAARGSSTAPAVWLPQYSAALAANAAQVHAYLNRYAAVGGLPAGQLAAVNELYMALQHQQDAWHQLQQQQQPGRAATSSSSSTDGGSADAAALGQLEALVDAQLSFLTAAADLARRRFTLFQQGPIWLGCVLAVLLVVGQLWYLRRLVSQPLSAGQQLWSLDRFSMVAFAGLAAFHALGLFSIGLLMGEGRLTCVLLAAITLILLRAALTAVLQARKAAQAVAATTGRPQGAGDSKQPGAGAATKGSGAANGVSVAEDLATDLARQQQLRLVLPAAQVWGSWRPSSQAVRAAVSMLVCNASLQLLGLIDRAGQDPHDKTQPTSELLVGPDAAWQRGALLAFTVAPLLIIWLVLTAASKLLQDRCQAGVGAGRQGVEQLSAESGVGVMRKSVSRVVLRWLQAVCAAQFACLGSFWAAQLSGHSGATVGGVAAAVWEAVLQSPLAPAAAAVAGSPGAVLGSQFLSSVVLSLPVRLLLPRVIYIAALLALGLAVIPAVWPGSGRRSKSGVKAVAQPGPEGVVLLLWLCGVLTAPLMMVLGFKGPAIMLLALLQAAGLCKLLWLRQAASGFARDAAGASQQGSGKVKRDSTGADGVGDGGCSSVVGAGAWGLMALQLFFCSGHFCEFSGLQYASAFIGFDDMVWYSSGSLLLMNTCGFLFLGCVSLPVFLACCTPSPAVSSKDQGSTARNDSAVLRQQVECGLWVINCMRFAALAVSLVSAAVQQQHILLWAIFAPKLVFELWFMFVTAAGELLVAGILPFCF